MIRAVLLTAGGLALGLTMPAAASAPAPTLFGHGPEVYVAPTMVKLGSRLSVAGLGYQPGRHAVVSLLVFDPSAGGPPSYWENAVRAQTIVQPDGRLRATFIVPTSIIPKRYPEALVALDVSVHYGVGPAAGNTPPIGHDGVTVLMNLPY